MLVTLSDSVRISFVIIGCDESEENSVPSMISK